MSTGNTPIYARKDSLLNTVNVVDGEFAGDKFALCVTDAAAKEAAETLADLLALEQTAAAPKPQYSYTFTWTDGNMTNILRDSGTETANLAFTWDAEGQLTNIGKWI